MTTQSDTPKVYLDSAEINCKSNSILGSRLLRYFRRNGYQPTNDLSEADVIVINTCGFDVGHEILSKELVGAAYEGRKPGAKVVSIGCLNKINPDALEGIAHDLHLADGQGIDELIQPAAAPFDEIREDFLEDEVYDHLGPHGENTPVLHQTYLRLGERLLDLSERSGPLLNADAIHLRATLDEVMHQNKLYVRIGSGCVGNCAYCAIKKAHGTPKSRPIPDILADIEAAYKGQSAVNLVADDCASYGVDTGQTLFELMDALNDRFPDIPLDLCYINPYWIETFPSEYREMLRTSNLNSINISMQSGSNRIVKLMNRKYRVENVLRFVDDVRRISPKTMIWAHFMVNFPTETWKDFADTLRAARHFDFYYTFAFSSREGTKAYDLGEPPPDEVGKIRKEVCYASLAAQSASRLLNLSRLRKSIFK